MNWGYLRLYRENKVCDDGISGCNGRTKGVGRAEAELVSHVKQTGMFRDVFCSLWVLLFL